MTLEIHDFPLVSVIIPAYNAEKFIQKTLNSVLSQTYKNIEVIVVDDGSEDRTAEIVKCIAETDQRVVLLKQQNAGVAAARNLAIEHSKGDYIAPIDADDIWYPQNLEKQLECLLQSDSSVGVTYAWSVDIDETDQLTGGFYTCAIEGEVYTSLIYKYFIGNASASLIRRACLEKVGGYSSQLKEQNAQGCEDWELHLRIAEHYHFRVVPEFLVGYRQIINSMSCNYSSMAKSHNLIMREVQERYPEVFNTIYRWSSSNFYVYLAVKSSRNHHYQSTLYWLYQALKLDIPMTLLRHNLYTLSIHSLLKLCRQFLLSQFRLKVVIQPQVRAFKPAMTLMDITRRIEVHKRLPSQVYERMRFKSLRETPKLSKFCYQQIAASKSQEVSSVL
jgi:glycosyltransferase involved in cell wall biosynthesis